MKASNMVTARNLIFKLLANDWRKECEI